MKCTSSCPSPHPTLRPDIVQLERLSFNLGRRARHAGVGERRPDVDRRGDERLVKVRVEVRG